MNNTQQFRTTERDNAHSFPEARKCEAAGCTRSTRERKPYCPGHVEEHPYVQELVSVLQHRDDELRRVARQGPRAVDPCGITAGEIVLQLKLYGNRTVPRLARDLALEDHVVHNYAKALARRGVLSLSRTSRGLILLIPRNLQANGCASESAA